VTNVHLRLSHWLAALQLEKVKHLKSVIVDSNKDDLRTEYLAEDLTHF
jgi:hypothetical protein